MTDLNAEQIAAVLAKHSHIFAKGQLCNGCKWSAPVTIGLIESKMARFYQHQAEMIIEAAKPIYERMPDVYADFNDIVEFNGGSYVDTLKLHFTYHDIRPGQEVWVGDREGHRVRGTVIRKPPRSIGPRDVIQLKLDMTTFINPPKEK